jgi:hypothetical protein
MADNNPSMNANLHNILTYENNIMINKTAELNSMLLSLQKHIFYMNEFLMKKYDLSSANPDQVCFVNITTYDNSGNVISSVTSDNSGNFVPVLMSDSSGHYIPCILPPDLSNNHMFTRGVVPNTKHEGSRRFPYYSYYPRYPDYPDYPYFPHYPYYYPYTGSDDYNYRSFDADKAKSPHHPIIQANDNTVSADKTIQPMGQHIHIYTQGYN